MSISKFLKIKFVLSGRDFTVPSSRNLHFLEFLLLFCFNENVELNLVDTTLRQQTPFSRLSSCRLRIQSYPHCTLWNQGKRCRLNCALDSANTSENESLPYRCSTSRSPTEKRPQGQALPRTLGQTGTRLALSEIDETLGMGLTHGDFSSSTLRPHLILS